MIDAGGEAATAPRIVLIEDQPGDARLVMLMLAELDERPFEVIHVDRLSRAWIGCRGAAARSST